MPTLPLYTEKAQLDQLAKYSHNLLENQTDEIFDENTNNNEPAFCNRFRNLAKSSQLIASNEKKVVYLTDDKTIAFKHIAPHKAKDFGAKNAKWKIHRVFEKQRRDLIYERWLLPRLEEIESFVELYSSFDLQLCDEESLRERGIVNLLEFVPQVSFSFLSFFKTK